eukprot:UN02965
MIIFYNIVLGKQHQHCMMRHHIYPHNIQNNCQQDYLQTTNIYQAFPSSSNYMDQPRNIIWYLDDVVKTFSSNNQSTIFRPTTYPEKIGCVSGDGSQAQINNENVIIDPSIQQQQQQNLQPQQHGFASHQTQYPLPDIVFQPASK